MNTFQYPKPVLGIAAFSGTGKTQLLTTILPQLKQSGLRVGVIKHAHHDVDIDKPGKDSYEMRQAGATPVVLASDKRIAVMIEKPESVSSSIDELLSYINPESVDLVLVEGFKELKHKKLFLFRHQIKDRFQELDEKTCSIMNHENTLAIITDVDKNTIASKLDTEKSIININHTEDVTAFILNYMQTETKHD